MALDARYREEFLTGYLECLLWQSTDPESGDSLESLGYTLADVSAEDRATVEAEVADFLDGLAGEILALLDARPEYTPDMAGHDYCLSRNRHGAGYWDRGLGPLGDRLHEIAKPYGPQSLAPATEDHSGGLQLVS